MNIYKSCNCDALISENIYEIPEVKINNSNAAATMKNIKTFKSRFVSMSGARKTNLKNKQIDYCL
jgi:hypothetical protein